jgi:protein TonB
MPARHPNHLQERHAGPLNSEARCSWTLIASVALHAAVIFAVQVVPRGDEPRLPQLLQVRIENVVSGPLVQETISASPALPPADTPMEPPAPAAEPQAEPEPPRPQAAPPEPAQLLPRIEAALPEDPTYYPARQLDVHPRTLGAIVPSYPARAADAGISGNLILLLLIDEAGVVRDASVAEANPEGWFEESALEAFRNARFAPAQRKGRAVKSRVLIRVTYELNAQPALGAPVMSR